MMVMGTSDCSTNVNGNQRCLDLGVKFWNSLKRVDGFIYGLWNHG